LSSLVTFCLSSSFAVFEGRDGIRKFGLGACFGYLGDKPTTRIAQGKEAEHGAYPHFRFVATGIPMRLYPAELPNLCPAYGRLVPFPPPPLRDGVDPVQRLDPARPPQPLPPLLQPCPLVAGCVVPSAGLPAGRRVRSGRPGEDCFPGAPP